MPQPNSQTHPGEYQIRGEGGHDSLTPICLTVTIFYLHLIMLMNRSN